MRILLNNRVVRIYGKNHYFGLLVFEYLFANIMSKIVNFTNAFTIYSELTTAHSISGQK